MCLRSGSEKDVISGGSNAKKVPSTVLLSHLAVPPFPARGKPSSIILLLHPSVWLSRGLLSCSAPRSTGRVVHAPPVAGMAKEMLPGCVLSLSG